MKTRFLVSLSALLLVSTTAAAFAEPVRFHRGIGVGVVVGLAEGSQVATGALAPTLHVDVGARLAPSASIYLRGEIGTILLANQAAAYAVGEWMPAGRLSLATGVGIDGMISYCGSECSKDNSWIGVSFPLIVGFNLSPGGAHALRLELEGAAGVDTTSTVGWHTALSLEWVWN